MACALDWDVDDCALGHWCDPLDAHREPASWRARCPHSGGGRSLAFWISGGSIRWRCWDADCERRLAHAALVAALPTACVPAFRTRAPGGRLEPADLKALVDADMPRLSLHLALLEMSGMKTKEALIYLGVRREHRSRVIAGRTIPGAKPQVS